MQNTTVYVGLSGGVDSSVAALRLKEAGYRVVGAFIKIALPEMPGCTALDDRISAMRTAAALEIPFYEVDLTEIYRTRVIEFLTREYAAGRTPNPDVLCNRDIKFGAFLTWAMEDGADCIATGHYAQRSDRNGRPHLLQSVDDAKDQTYFLWQISEEKLSRTLLPIGDMRKDEVRAYAKMHGLHTAKRPDSQGLCFLGAVDMKDFLKEHLELSEGDVVTADGTRIGYHPGIPLFTTGERHGFVITDERYRKTPLYVLSKDVKHNRLVVGREFPCAAGGTIRAAETSFIHNAAPSDGAYLIRIRHTGRLIPATLTFSNGAFTAAFSEEIRGAAAGQSVVVYDRNECLGGGILVA